MVAKSFPRKQVPTKNFHQIFLVENFLRLQNHFLGNRFDPKIFIKNFFSKIFYYCKIISSKTGLNQKFSSTFFWSIIFYGCKIISSKTGFNQKSSTKIFWSKNFMVAKSFPQKHVQPKIFIKKRSVENLLQLQNHFLENRFETKIFIIYSLPKYVYGCKIIFSRTGLKFCMTIVGRKFFMDENSFPRIQV